MLSQSTLLVTVAEREDIIKLEIRYQLIIRYVLTLHRHISHAFFADSLDAEQET